MRLNSKFLFVFLLSFGCFNFCFAQTKLQGTVKDVHQKTISSAIITLLKEDKIISFTQSNTEGKFQLEASDAQLQNAQLKISKLGFAPQMMAIDLKKEFYSIILQEQAVTLKEVKVTPPVSKRGDTIRSKILKMHKTAALAIFSKNYQVLKLNLTVQFFTTAKPSITFILKISIYSKRNTV